MATLLMSPLPPPPPATRHHHTELISGILITNQYLHVPGLEVKREGGLGKTQHKNGRQAISP